MEPYVQLLGPPFIRLGQIKFQPPPSRSSALAYRLAYSASQWVARDEVSALLWPESRDEHARNSLRQALYVLRDEPWAAGIEAERQRIRWSVATDLTREDTSRKDPFILLDGFFLPRSPSFHDWLELSREHVLSKARRAAHDEAHAARARRRPAEATERLEPWLRHDPLDEETLRLLLESKVAEGLRADANALYIAFAERLDREFGFEPTPATQACVLVGATQDGDVTGGRSPSSGDQLDMAIGAFLGRGTETERLEADLRSAGGIYAVVGPPGIGKTRLAVEVARSIADRHAWDVHVVSLETHTTGVSAAASIAIEVAPTASPDRDPIDRIEEHFGRRTALLVIDNVEQIPDIESTLQILHGR